MMITPHPVLLCYAPADDAHRASLVRHLQPLIDKGVLALQEHEVECPAPALDRFAAVVVLMSPEMAATPCLSTVMLPAVPEQTPIIPVIVRSCAWDTVIRLSRRAALPRGLKPMVEQADPESVWRAVANGVRIACEPPEREAPKSGRAETPLSRAAFMALGLGLMAAGPVWLWISG